MVSTFAGLTVTSLPLESIFLIVIGIPITIKKIDSSSNTVTVNPASVETIDSVLTYTIRVQYDICTIVSDGVNWNLI